MHVLDTASEACSVCRLAETKPDHNMTAYQARSSISESAGDRDS